MTTKHRFSPIHALLATALFSGCTLPATAQIYPSRPIQFIVASGPGTTADLAARVVSPGISQRLGQPVIVEDKPGANQAVGLEYVAKQMPADGYTVGVFTVDGVALLPLTAKDLRFDPINDITPVIGIMEGRLVFGSPASAPWNTFDEMVAYAKANPGKLNFGSSAPTILLPMIIVLHGKGLDVPYIPYASGAQYIRALAAGEVQMGFLGEASVVSLGTQFKSLAITGSQRKPNMPNVPTTTELGFPEVRGSSHALNVRVGTPPAIIDKLHAAASVTLETAEVKAQLAKAQQEVVDDTQPQAAKRLTDLAKIFADVVKTSGVKLD